MGDNFRCDREIYAKGSFMSGKNNDYYAVLAGENLMLGDHSTIRRWAKAKNIDIGHMAHVEGRLSAEQRIVINPSAQFTYLHAPIIKFVRSNQDSLFLSPPSAIKSSAQQVPWRPANNIDDKRWIIAGDLTIPANTEVNADIIVRGHLQVGAGTKIVGSVKAYGDIRLQPQVIVLGSLVSVANIKTGYRNRIRGPVIAEGEVEIGAESIIGTRSTPTTVTGLRTYAWNGAIVHGTVQSNDPKMRCQ